MSHDIEVHSPEKNREPETEAETLLRRSRRWLLTVGTALAIVGTVIGFVADALGLLEFVRPEFVSREEPGRLARLTITEPVVLTPGSLQTPTPPNRPADAPTQTPVSIVAEDGERLLLVSQFANFADTAGYNVAGRIAETLADQVDLAGLAGTRVVVWPELVSEEPAAADVLFKSRAAILIWGEYDSGRVRVNFALPGQGKAMGWQRLLASPNELTTTINLDVPREAQALALTALGRLYRDNGDPERARAAFEQALALQPTEADTVATLAFYLAYLHTSTPPIDLNAAIDEYTRVIDLRPQWANAHYNRGVAYLDLYYATAAREILSLAADDFTSTLDAVPDYAEALINRGIVYYLRNDADDVYAALQDFTAAAARSPDDYRPFYNRGLAYIRASNATGWEEDLSRSLALAPDYWQAHYALCWGYALDNRPDMGLEHCELAIAQDNSGAVSDAYCLVLAELGQLPQAAAQASNYLDWLSTLPPAWYATNNGPLFVGVLDALTAGKTPVTPELLTQLR